MPSPYFYRPSFSLRTKSDNPRFALSSAFKTQIFFRAASAGRIRTCTDTGCGAFLKPGSAIVRLPYYPLASAFTNSATAFAHSGLVVVPSRIVARSMTEPNVSPWPL